MGLRANILANVGGQVASAAIALLLAPLFVQQLGLAAWGLVGVLVVLSAWFNLLDVGLTPAITRELARAEAGEAGVATAAGLVRCVEWIYLALALAIVAAMTMLAAPIVDGWLRLEGEAGAAGTTALAWMGVIIACRLAENVYRAVLSGLQRMVLLNLLGTAAALLRWAGALAWVLASGRGMVALFEWQAGASLLSLAVFALAARRRLTGLPGFDGAVRADWSALRRVRAFAGGMAATTLLAFALTQVDKILLSRLLSLADFGAYMLATSLADTLALLAAPLYAALVPRFTQLIAQGDEAAVLALYRRAAQCLAAVLMPCALLLVIHAEAVARVWTGVPALAAQIAPLLAMLAAGRALNAVLHVPAALQVGAGWSSLAAGLNAAAVLVLVPLILWSVPRWGAVAAAGCWLGLNGAYLMAVSWRMHQRLLRRERWRWLAAGVLAPAVVSALVMGASTALPLPDGRALLGLWLVALVLVAAALSAWVLPEARTVLRAAARALSARRSGRGPV